MRIQNLSLYRYSGNTLKTYLKIVSTETPHFSGEIVFSKIDNTWQSALGTTLDSVLKITRAGSHVEITKLTQIGASSYQIEIQNE